MMHDESDSATPTMPGQDAFGAIQEIVRILEILPQSGLAWKRLFTDRRFLFGRVPEQM
jgi:hypothetical protein